VIAQMIGADDNPTVQLIGHEVRAARRRQGMDQAMLAMVANVGVRSVYRVEHDETTVRFDILLRILEALGLGLEVKSRGEA
jgi:HTH-type transcriptional regulator/antitoxin HipB